MNRENLATDIIFEQNKKIKILTALVILLALVTVSTNLMWAKNISGYKKNATMISITQNEQPEIKPKTQRIKKEG